MKISPTGFSGTNNFKGECLLDTSLLENDLFGMICPVLPLLSPTDVAEVFLPAFGGESLLMIAHHALPACVSVVQSVRDARPVSSW